MRKITDDKTLTHYISLDIGKSMEKIRRALEEDMRKELITSVYQVPGNPEPAVYERQFNAGGFWGSWRASKTEIEEGKGGRAWTTKLFSDPKLMTWNPDRFIHGSPGDAFYYGGQTVASNEIDRRENLDEYIAEGTNYDFPDPYWLEHIGKERAASYNAWWARPRDYWTPLLIKWYAVGSGIGYYFMYEMAMLGADISEDG